MRRNKIEGFTACGNAGLVTRAYSENPYGTLMLSTLDGALETPDESTLST